MRLTSTQLRTIIAEEVARIHGRRLSEGAGVDMSYVVDAAGEKFYDAAYGAYNENDPSMAALGEDAWAAQVDQAAMDFKNEVNSVIDRVMSKLLDGEYA